MRLEYGPQLVSLFSDNKPMRYGNSWVDLSTTLQPSWVEPEGYKFDHITQSGENMGALCPEFKDYQAGKPRIYLAGFRSAKSPKILKDCRGSSLFLVTRSSNLE